MVTSRSRRAVLGLLGASSLLLNSTAHAQPTAADEEAALRAAESCTWQHPGGQLATVLCTEGLEQVVWVAAGKAACADHTLCAAWIYQTSEGMPNPVPMTFDGLTQQNVISAVAVWIAESSNLVLIEAVN